MSCAPTAWPPSSFSPSSSAPLGAIGMFTLCTPAGTNEQAIIDVLTKRSNAQRQQIAKSFKAQFGKVKGGQEAFLGRLRGCCDQRPPGRQLFSGPGLRLETSF